MTDDIEHINFWQEAERPFVDPVVMALTGCSVYTSGEPKGPLFPIDYWNLSDNFPDMVP